MQLLNCQVAIGGDLNNKGVICGVTPPEIQTLRMIHGPGSISDVVVVGKMHQREYSHEDIYLQIKNKYPRHAHIVQEYWRDNGARFPVDVRQLDLPDEAFRMPVDTMIENLGKADEATEEAAPKVRRGRPAKEAKPAPVPEPIEDLEFADPDEE